MVQVVEPRVVRLSWRPTKDPFGATRIGEWITRLKKRLAFSPRDRSGRRFVIQDMNEVAGDRAAIREGRWTDFVGVLTVDYVLTCNDEGDAGELIDACQRAGAPGLLLWLARLESTEDLDLVEVGGMRPWCGPHNWIVVPPEGPPLSQDERTVDADMEQKLLCRLRSACTATA